MVSYVYWPEHLYSRPDEDGAIAIGISLEGSDIMVLDTVPRNGAQTALEHPYCEAAVSEAGGTEWQFGEKDVAITRFDAPRLDLMQFFALEPISLTLPEKQNHTSDVGNMRKLYEYSRYFHTDSKLRQSVSLINLYYSHLSAFHTKYPQLTTAEQQYRPWRSIFAWYKQTTFNRLICWTFLHIIVMLCTVAYSVSAVLNWRYLPLANVSATARQIDLRCRQLCYFPVQYLMINKNKLVRKKMRRFSNHAQPAKGATRDFPCKFYPDYIRFYNTIWLMINDLSFGLIIGSVISDKSGALCPLINRAVTYCLNDLLKSVTTRLANNPFGIKLNDELTRFLSDLFLWIIEFANFYVITPFTSEQSLSKLLKVVSKTMILIGASFGFSLLADFFTLISLHIYCFYHIINKLYSWQLNAMMSLFYLFRGKKRNKLRHRVDFHSFDLDQLLMGMLIFVPLVYLTPTVLAFYISYTVLRLFAIYFEIGLNYVIALINHFPLFALLLRIKDPKRLPGGVSLTTADQGNSFKLKNNPLQFGMMFSLYTVLLGQIGEQYCSLGTLKKILGGRPISLNRNRLYCVLYSSLPVEPMMIHCIYEELLETLPNEHAKHEAET
ncbi:phosphatidylinositol N-acetylglucosaminyltransferase KNAG_0G00650 [Huiozyma naganishii CBS 8797]|uniref:Uncharacterized protein n=1 Tax=Huiozyma naganishii (strain ATCC MYA-139 / BCRC 22969 / CBS 8797 / KCTC 17520 / NBRC 10181 / NCYC 3082 / Yp74L-3) TaxID=1071383 RepID=J7S8V1_HUIN7|nr:hypothetical protein KNAG_0G00650 [Kazachstania naganishii CBS 8797]CCK71121.1 hypothetical protein KNAG_0G00650 [Kazachstania naganishii CBS 8797]